MTKPILLVLYLLRILLKIRYGPIVLSPLSIHRILLSLESGIILETDQIQVLFLCCKSAILFALGLQDCLSQLYLEVCAECDHSLTNNLLHFVFGLLLFFADA
jgi:hypothetical protein